MAETTYPKIFSNINVPARVIHNESEEAELGSSWVELDLKSQGLALTPAPATE
jgi:hypothetical protein